MRLIIKGGHVVCPCNRIDRPMDLLVEDGIIAACDENAASAVGSDRVVDARGMHILPGLMDMHVHLREPGEEYKESIETGTLAAARGGFTDLACMPNTKLVNDNPSVTSYILEKARQAAHCRVHPVCAITPGLCGKGLCELGLMAAAGAVAASDDGKSVADAGLMRRALEYAATFNLPVLCHCEDISLCEGGVMHEGRVATAMGLAGIPSAAEWLIVERDIALAQITGARVHICHVSTRQSVEAIRQAKAKGIPVTAETAPHYFTLTHRAVEGYNTVAKVNPPLREQADVDAVIQGLADGTLDAIATDHAPHSPIEKAVEFDLAAFGMVGLETAIPLALALVHKKVLTLMQLAEKMAKNPRSILNIDAPGIRPGAPADITILDINRKVKVTPETFASKSKNTPFEGMELTGAVAATIFGGRMVFDAL
ncbi:MAG: dihydroorotase [Desulfatibacillaceae bacterium]|nr:dihydroorotase [Desulfatibacillaceae bacterium]